MPVYGCRGGGRGVQGPGPSYLVHLFSPSLLIPGSAPVWLPQLR
uniref:Uncharacterized protein n=1 Tax=Arundo donax TaxID=35708 RepID=A0A0A9GYF9_ARUDO